MGVVKASTWKELKDMTEITENFLRAKFTNNKVKRPCYNNNNGSS